MAYIGHVVDNVKYLLSILHAVHTVKWTKLHLLEASVRIEFLWWVVCVICLRDVSPEGIGVLPYKDSTGMCRAKVLYFSALAAPKDSTFSTWAAPKDPIFQNIQFFIPLFRPGQINKTLVLKIYVSLLFLARKSPFFPWVAVLKAPYFQWGVAL